MRTTIALPQPRIRPAEPLFERLLSLLFGAPVSDADAAKLYQEYCGGMTKADWRAEREWQAEQDAASAWWCRAQGDET